MPDAPVTSSAAPVSSPDPATSDAELRALYEALPMGVAFLGPDLRYQRVNAALARMNGRSVAAHVGASPAEILGESAGEVEAALRKVIRTRRPLEVEFTAALPGTSEVRAFEATYFPVFAGQHGDAAGDELLGVGAVVLDLADRHAAYAEQARLLREALIARAHAEAAEVRADDAREEA